MPTPRLLCLSLLATGALAACVSAGPRGGCGGPRQPDELSRLARIADSAGTVARQSVDTLAAEPRQVMQNVVDRVGALDRCGALRTTEDLRDAAATALAARTLGVATVERAYLWARRAVTADTADRRNWRIMALAWDQLQVMQKKPQWWATVVTCTSPVLGRCSLAPLDSTRISDAMRHEFGLPSLKQQRALVDSLNRVRGQP